MILDNDTYMMMRPSSSSSDSARSSLLPPTPSKPTYIRLGIGGAGNIHKASSLPPYSPNSLSATPSHNSCPSSAGSSNSSTACPRSSSQSTMAPLLPSGRQQQKTHFTSGIGGAGNIHAYTERNALDAAEEVARARAVALRVSNGNAGPWHVGIGGAGNHRKGGNGGNGNAARLRSRKSEAALCRAAARSETVMMMARETEESAAAFARAYATQQEKDVYISSDEEDAVRLEKPVSYSADPLPYGALDLLRRQISQTFGAGGNNSNNKAVTRVGAVDEKHRHLQSCANERQQQQPRRTLRTHRSLWRF